MTKNILNVSLMVIIVTLFGCGDSVESKKRSLTIAGSTTVLPIVTLAAESFQEGRYKNKISINAGGSGVGVSYIARQLADIGMLSRDLSDKERLNYKNTTFYESVIGVDAIACVVSEAVFSSGVTSLSKKQLAAIYQGDITNWSEVGGFDREILVVDKEYHRGTRYVFMKYVMGNSNALAPGAKVVTGSNNEEQSKISQNDNAIGMLSFAWIGDGIISVAIRENDKLIYPTIENVKNNLYPMARKLKLLVVNEDNLLAKQFIDYILSTKGQELVKKAGYVAVN